jgi:UDP-3-O-acyl N-acetylglucosamine deacetylase
MSRDRSGFQRQATLAESATIHGRGLFHGIPATMTLRPAPEGHGIVFRRTDLPGRPLIPAHVDNVAPAPRRTVISNARSVRVETIEHIMSALAGLQISNCLVDISGPEIPAVDGSALPFCEAILEAGICEQAAAAPRVAIPEPIAAAENSNGHRIEVTTPREDTWCVSYRLEFHAAEQFPPQSLSLELTPEIYLNEIAAARTFVFEAEIEALQSRGFGRHLTESDLIVFGADAQPVGNSLRWDDEPVRHKVLDCIGDLYLSGGFVSGDVIACRSGHALNHVMAGILARTPYATRHEPDSDRLAA